MALVGFVVVVFLADAARLHAMEGK